MRTPRVAIIGAGMAGLAAAVDLSRAGLDVSLYEKSATAGGKMRQIEVDGAAVDAGPTVLTMKWVFERLFDDAGHSFSTAVPTLPLEILARHVFDDKSRLDLFADVHQSANAIASLAGPKEARGFLDFINRAKSTYATLEGPFILSEQPSPVSLALGAGLRGLSDLWKISPFTTLWKALGDHFSDYRLRQLFGRYATYCGSSPFDCPATLMLVAHVEQQGVWFIDGGMQKLAQACQALALQLGTVFHFNAEVSRVNLNGGSASGITLADGQSIAADAVIVNADPAALSSGLLGEAAGSAVSRTERAARSLSAVTLAAYARTSGFPLEHHNVFFCNDYVREFADIFQRAQPPEDPTVYICAQDRRPLHSVAEGTRERLLLLINAPPTGDRRDFNSEDVERCMSRIRARLSHCGLTVDALDAAKATTPSDFNRLFPATGGALYGQASHGWTASFTRPAAKTHCPRLYLAGGAAHPGPGVPMAALSGRIAARAVLRDLTSRTR